MENVCADKVSQNAVCIDKQIVLHTRSLGRHSLVCLAEQHEQVDDKMRAIIVYELERDGDGDGMSVARMLGTEHRVVPRVAKHRSSTMANLASADGDPSAIAVLWVAPSDESGNDHQIQETHNALKRAYGRSRSLGCRSPSLSLTLSLSLLLR